MRETFRTIRRRDIAVLSGISLVLLAIILGMTGTSNLFGSMTDWVSQHSVLPDYYRQTFYETGDFLPELALSLGSGQNAYYFGYYGFLNPVILVSYLFPGVSMVTYLQVASVVMLLSAVWLFFLWLRHIRVAFGEAVSFGDGAIYTATALFAFASPLLYHSHKQIVFVNYMPFLLLALIGADRYFHRRRKGLLAVSAALLLFTSYFYAVPGFCVITLYGVYRFFTVTEHVTWKKFLHKGCGFALCIVTGAALSAILTVPSLLTILGGRQSGAKARMEFHFLLIGDMDLAGSICYSEYSMGMTAITYLALCVTAIGAFKKKKDAPKQPADGFLAIGILLCAWLPWIRLVLNGFLYTREKILIPFVPAAAFLTARMIHKIQKEEISLRTFTLCSAGAVVLGTVSFLFRMDLWSVIVLLVDSGISVFLLHFAMRKKNLNYLYITAGLIAVAVCVRSTLRDNPVERAFSAGLYDKERDRAIESVLEKDDELYRSAVFTNTKYVVNQLHGKRFLTTGYYSSLGNSDYLGLLYKDLGVANPSQNDISYMPQSDIFLQTFLGVRYIAAGNAPAGRKELVPDAGKTDRIYANREAYALAFAADRRMSLREFRSLSPADREIALLSYAVTEEDGPDVYVSPLEDTGIEVDFGAEQDAKGNLNLGVCLDREFTVPVPDSLDEYVYVVTFRVAKRRREYISVTVNGITNVLSGTKNARPNVNFDMKFVVSSSEPCNELTFRFTGENVVISKPRIQRMRVSEVREAAEHMTMAADLKASKNRITGTVSMKERGVLIMTVPYDKGWTVSANGKEMPLIKADGGFLGCLLEAGEHSFTMVYHAPGRTAGIGISIVGFILLLGLWIVPRIQEKRSVSEDKKSSCI